MCCKKYTIVTVALSRVTNEYLYFDIDILSYKPSKLALKIDPFQTYTYYSAICTFSVSVAMVLAMRHSGTKSLNPLASPTRCTRGLALMPMSVSFTYTRQSVNFDPR